MTLHLVQEYDVVALHPAIFDFQLFSQKPLRARHPPQRYIKVRCLHSEI